MQQYHWWGASSGNVDGADWVSGSGPLKTAYWNEMAWSGSKPISWYITGLNGHSKEAAY